MAFDPVNMSLDDVIASTRGKKSVRGRGGPRGGGNRRESGGRSSGWKNDKYDAIFGNGRRAAASTSRRTSGGAGAKFAPKTRSAVSTSGGAGKVLISNLPRNVSTADLEQLFKGYQIKEVIINHDEMGQSLGTAMVYTPRKPDATKLIKDFFGAAIDGKSMKFTDLAEDSRATAEQTILSRVSVRKMPQIRKEKGTAIVKSDHRASGGKPFLKKGGPKKGGARPSKTAIPTAEDLDKDLDSYMSRGKPKADEKME